MNSIDARPPDTAVDPRLMLRRECGTGNSQDADEGNESEESALLHMRFQELRARVDLEALFAEGLMDEV